MRRLIVHLNGRKRRNGNIFNQRKEKKKFGSVTQISRLSVLIKNLDEKLNPLIVIKSLKYPFIQ